MNSFAIYALAAALNALIVCSALSLFTKKLPVSELMQNVITFLIYIMIAFVLSSGGHGIFDIDMEVFNLTQFLLYFCGGVCVCITKYVVLQQNKKTALAAKNAKTAKRK